jgi:uncharacterized protein YkwD
MKHSLLRNLGCSVIVALLASCGNGIDPNQVITPMPSASDSGSAGERKIAALARGHSQQKRTSLIWDKRLTQAARARAKDMGTRGFFSHVDPDGHGPNWHITKTGYRLPIKWTAFKGANQVESILAGHESPDAAFKMWMGSPKHVSHILALNHFYADQTRIGVGYAYVPNSPYKHYWVFLSAPPEK